MKTKEIAMYLISKYINKEIIINTTIDSIPTQIKGNMDFKSAKECALILVNEIINDYEDWGSTVFIWNKIKQEIEKL